ncbi:MAG: type II toxin-antitoxin system VapC family toxin [Bradymonadales bacterium]|nr:type II toxin-antitoxin system VapC family toxin [Bradymonadales bacterium]
MIIPDINLLVYAYSRNAPLHRQARTWLEGLMRKGEPLGLPWAVILGFVRLMTHPAVLVPPLRPAQVLAQVASWLDRPPVRVLDPGPRHLLILTGLLDALGVAGRLTTDAHLAALAIEYQAELHSSDTDFGRFPGLRWRNPL